MVITPMQDGRDRVGPHKSGSSPGARGQSAGALLLRLRYPEKEMHEDVRERQSASRQVR
jgi:hypothetical protein